MVGVDEPPAASRGCGWSVRTIVVGSADAGVEASDPPAVLWPLSGIRMMLGRESSDPAFVGSVGMDTVEVVEPAGDPQPLPGASR
jgi:hypothetical protein